MSIIYLFIYLLIYLFIYLFIYIFIYLFICLFIYLFIYSLFIVDLQLMKQPYTIKNSYVYKHANKHQLPNVEKMKICKLNINLKKRCITS